MSATGWNRLLADPDWCRGRGRFPIPAYSEYMPPPWLGVNPYGTPDPYTRPAGDNWGWNVSEYEQTHELAPGLEVIAREVLEEVVKLGTGRAAPQITRRKLRDNPYWPDALAGRAVGTLIAIYAMARFAPQALGVLFACMILIAVALSVAGLRFSATPGRVLGAGVDSGIMGKMS